MTIYDVTLEDRYDLDKTRVLLNGTQALVRLVLMQKAWDAQAGLTTAGYVTGYRGSPLGAVDFQMRGASQQLEAHNITFQEGLNEDLAATALWGAQQAELRGEGRYDGVFGLWYGKGPGVDRSGDVFRHANLAGTSKFGGVLACMGDDHTGESSTTLHQSEFTFIDSMMPILAPAGVQEVLDYGLMGYALSRYSGCWVGLKCVKDTIEVTEVVDANPERIQPILPVTSDDLNIRLIDTPQDQELRLHNAKRPAVTAFAKANALNKQVWGAPKAKIGLVGAGKNWLDLVHALSLLGLDQKAAEALGLTTYKIGMVWPLETEGFTDWAEKLDLIIVVEEKRKILEPQIKDALYHLPNRPRVLGWKHDQTGEILFPETYALDPSDIARKLGSLFAEEGLRSPALQRAQQHLEVAAKTDNLPDLATRKPYFCSGCPHNSSTKLPDGARAYAGIGCHYMVQWMDRETTGFTQMGGEGANWIGEAPFSNRPHVFQNVGDGTYNHSGLQAIRAAIAADTTMTFKILYNDAVAMTGGQGNDGDLTAAQIAQELAAMGIKKLAVVHDEKEPIRAQDYPAIASIHPRSDLMAVQKDCEATKGVSSIVYVQTCAAEKRRRRKKGTFLDPDTRVFINPSVCEGCGDCSVQSNCVAVVPMETELGRKRQIDQSACNKDYSCLNGFCPSFITVSGAALKTPEVAELNLPDLPEPTLPKIDKTHNLVITGVGGTGVVTIGAVLAMAAHLEGKGVGMMEMAGLAQKGGAVQIHCRLAETPSDIAAIRVSLGEAHGVIGGDLVVTGGAKSLSLMRRGQTKAVCNTHEIITGDFTRDGNFYLPTNSLRLVLEARLGAGSLQIFDASQLALTHLGDSIYSNTILLGAAWQNGLIPLGYDAIQQAIRLNGTSVAKNLQAFELGRLAITHPDQLPQKSPPTPKTLDEVITDRAAHLTQYQDAALADKYRAFIAEFDDTDLQRAIAESYHKLLAYKDEYEVARLHHTHAKAQIAAQFERGGTLKFHLAPPFMTGKGAAGRPKKRAFGAWILPVFGLLKRGKILRNTPFDLFGYSKERQMERALITQFETDMRAYANADKDTVLELAKLPQTIKGFGPVKAANAKAAAKRREELIAQLTNPIPLAAE